MNNINETRGYVRGLEKFTQYVLDIMEKIKERFIEQYVRNNPQSSNFDDVTKMKYSIRDYITKYGETNMKSLTQPIEIDSNTLKSLGVYGINKFIVSIYGNLSSSGMFSQYDSEYNGNNWDELSIELNLFLYMVGGAKEMAATIQHEMTHAYEYARHVKQKGIDSAKNSDKNHYYRSEMNDDNIVNLCSYIFSKTERNAVISSLYTTLQYSNANRENYQEVIQDSDYQIILNKMNEVRNRIANTNDTAFTEIVQWIKDNPEHVDMFPSIGNKSMTRYRKRLLQSIDSVISNFQTKGTRVVKYYLQQNQQ